MNLNPNSFYYALIIATAAMAAFIVWVAVLAWEAHLRTL